MTFSRRQLFGVFGNTAKSAASAAGFERARPTEKPTPAPEAGGIPAESPLAAEAREAALEILAGAGPEYGSARLSNHGPMVADALIALGRASAVLPWVEAYRRRLEERSFPGEAIARDRWRESLGDFRRAADWAQFFRRELAERPWRSVLSDWCARLAPAAPSAGFHGLLRTAHAARGMAARETIARQGELAEGLAYWAARYRALPDHAVPQGALLVPGTRLPIEALPDVELLDPSRRLGDSIADRLDRVGEQSTFPATAAMVDVTGEPSAFLTSITEAFAGVFLGHASAANAIALVHALTGPSAVRLLVPHIDDGAARVLGRHAWQGAAAIYAGFVGADPGSSPAADPAGAVPVGIETLVDRAVATGDEHAIKLTEACLRENAAAPRPDFPLVAQEGVRLLARGSSPRHLGN